MSQASPEPRHRDQSPGEDELWEAVADPSRRKVLDLILAHGQATPTTLAAELPFTRQAVAKHLAVLTRAGLVEGRRHGREVRYAPTPASLDSAVDWMVRAGAAWDARLNRLRARFEPQSPP